MDKMMKKWIYENEQWTQLPPYLRHLPLFTRDIDIFSIFVRLVFALFLKIFFHFYIHLRVEGKSFHTIYKENPRLLVICNHSSHLDAISIAAAIPFYYWINLYIAAAKDYFFTNIVFTAFSQHCLGAIPIDRKDRKGEAINLCVKLLSGLDRIWLMMFPEGTRTKDGFIQPFRRGVSVFAEKTGTPILFLYLQGARKLWPKGQSIMRPGILRLHVGPVHPPAPIETINEAYKDWVMQIDPTAYQSEETITT